MWQRSSARGPVPRLPPLLRWIQQLVAEHGLPLEAVAVAADLLRIMEESLAHHDARFQQYSRSMLRGSVGAAKAGGFLQLVLSLLPPPSQTALASDCTAA